MTNPTKKEKKCYLHNAPINPDCGCHITKDNPSPKSDWMEEFEKILRLWHYENIREKGIDEIKYFIQNLLDRQREEVIKEVIDEILDEPLYLGRILKNLLREKLLTKLKKGE